MSGPKSILFSQPASTSWLRRAVVGRQPGRTFRRALVLATGTFLLFRFALIPAVIRGESMAPTYRDGGVTLANALIYRLRDPVPGDIVMIRMAGRRTMYLKRILAVPGDRIQFRGGQLLVNGAIREEPYVVLAGEWNTVLESLGPSEFFVAGDHRSMAQEQHTMGVVDRSRIAGKVLF